MQALWRSLRGKHPNLERIVASVAWLSIDKARLFFSVAVGIWMARQFGPGAFGEFNYAFAVAGIVAIGADLGLESIVLRELVKSSGRRAELLGTAFWLRLGAAIPCYLALLIYGICFTDPESRLLIAVFGLMMFGQSFLTARCWFQAELEAKRLVLIQNYVFALATVARVVLLLLKAQLIDFAVVAVLEYWLGALALVASYQRQKGTFPWRHFRSQVAKELLGMSWPLLLSGASVVIYMKIDQVMLKEMLGSAATGTYAAAVKVSEAWYFLPGALALSLFPSIVRMRESSPAAYAVRLQQYFSLSVLLALAISIPFSLFAPTVVSLLYGHGYADTAPILAVHIWASVFVFLGGAREQFLVAEGFVVFSLLATAVGAIVNVALNYVLIPHYAGFGAALATLISYGVSAFLSSFANPKTRAVGWMQLRALVMPGVGLKAFINGG